MQGPIGPFLSSRLVGARANSLVPGMYGGGARRCALAHALHPSAPGCARSAGVPGPVRVTRQPPLGSSPPTRAAAGPQAPGPVRPVKHISPLVEAHGHGPVERQLVDHPLDFVPARVPHRIETGGPATGAPSATVVGTLVLRLRNTVANLTAAQETAVATGTVRFAAAQMVRPGARAATGRTGNTETVQNRDHLRGIAPLAVRDQQGQGPQPALTGQVDFRARPGPPRERPRASSRRCWVGRARLPGFLGACLRAPAAC